MSSFSFKLLPGANFDQQVRDAIITTFINKITRNNQRIRQRIGILLANALNKTPVIRSLRGGGVEDLPAHLGLNNGEAATLADAMIELVRQSPILTTRSKGGAAIINIKAIERSFIDFINLPGASYISERSGIEIPVIEWLLLDPKKDIGQAEFDIVFKGDIKGVFDGSIDRASRSGRALMISIEELGGGGGYVFPSIISGGAGGNFIDFIFNQPGLQEQVVGIIISVVK